MEEVRRASFSLFQGRRSPRSSFSISPVGDKSRSARASFSRSPRGSSAAIDDALMNMDWTPILGGSRYSVSRSSRSVSISVSKSPNSPVPQEFIICVEDADASVSVAQGDGAAEAGGATEEGDAVKKEGAAEAADPAAGVASAAAASENEETGREFTQRFTSFVNLGKHWTRRALRPPYKSMGAAVTGVGWRQSSH